MAHSFSENESYKTGSNSSCCYTEEQIDFESFLFSQATEITWKCCPPVIILLGTFGNVMTIVIMRRMSEGQSSKAMFLYFIALAVSDLIILYAGLLRKWVNYVYNVDLLLLHDAICRFQVFLINNCGLISAWLVVSMTSQRVLSVVWPHYKMLSYTKRKVGCVIGIIVLVCTAINYYRLHAYSVYTKLNSTEVFCDTVDDKGLAYFDWYIYPWIELATFSVVPFSILIVGNSVLMWKVIQSVQVVRVMTAGGCHQVNSRQKKASSLTVTLITVSLVFLLLTLPIAIFMLFECVVDLEVSKSFTYLHFIWAVCNLSWYVNSAINFYLYCLSGTRFRNEAAKLCFGERNVVKTSNTVLSVKAAVRYGTREQRVKNEF